jgi:enoyl-CoA hydratase
MQYKQIKWEVREIDDASDHRGLGILTLANPDRLNAIGPRMGIELDDVADVIRRSDVRAVIIRGEGKHFCAGGDLKTEKLSLEENEDRLGIAEGEYGDLLMWWLNDHFHVVLQRAYKKFENLPMPLIASIDGVCIGIGFELTLACDLRIMTDRARLAEIAVPVGFLSEWSATRNLAQLIGLSRATELIMTGRFVEAEEAERIGLVHQVVQPEDLETATNEMAERICALPFLGIRHAKSLIREYQSYNKSEKMYDAELDAILEITRSEDSIEGVRAFNAKRPPAWNK